MNEWMTVYWDDSQKEGKAWEMTIYWDDSQKEGKAWEIQVPKLFVCLSVCLSGCLSYYEGTHQNIQAIDISDSWLSLGSLIA